MADVELELITGENWREAMAVRVTEEQEFFVAECQPVALVILAKCHLSPDGRRWEPLLARNAEGIAVGVLAITYGDGTSELRHVAIDESYQGQGLGTALVQASIDRIRTDNQACAELVVLVNADNDPAHATYRSAGLEWQGTPDRTQGRWHLSLTDDEAEPSN